MAGAAGGLHLQNLGCLQAVHLTFESALIYIHS
jgi:hypothetical protein